MSNTIDSNPAPSTSPASGAARRPAAITVICILGLIGAVGAVWILGSGIARQVGSWYPPYLSVSAVIGGVSLFGFWRMRRWGVVIYTAFALINQVVLLVAGRWNVLVCFPDTLLERAAR